MNDVPNSKLLRVTRLLLLLILGLLAIAALIMLAVAAILPFHWTETVAEIAKQYPKLDASELFPKLYAIFALGLLILGSVGAIMRKLLAIIDSVALGDPFVLVNAARLKAIGWLMVAVQIIGIPLAVVASETADLFGKNNVGFDFSLNGVLAILLVFILAGIFEQGAAMREELEGTV
jgi:preprotein translocase subunit Sss1